MINALLGGFNLLPAFPLDGGRMLRAGLWKRRGDLLSATRLSTRISSFISYGMMGLGFIGLLFGGGFSGLWLIFIGWFLKNGSESSLRQTIISKALADVAVEDLMTEDAVSISAEISLSDAVQDYFYRHRHGGYPVVDGEKLVGIVTLEDIRDVPKEKRDTTTVEGVMTPKEEFVYARPDEPAVEALIKLSKHDVGRLPVMEGEKLIGILTRSDLMKAIRVRTELEVE
jgi:CBS domain-containing protein